MIKDMPVIRGVYRIHCTINDKSYIGGSAHIHKRWYLHTCDLRAKRHCNSPLQSAWELHGENAFSFNILEVVAGDAYELREAEQRWIDSIDPRLRFNVKYRASLVIPESSADRQKRKMLREDAARSFVSWLNTKPSTYASLLKRRK